ncbi:hypothetical protein LSA78_002778, partial [Listeria innocua]|nr:hypothetical protein [Listeria innocua]
SPKKKKPCYNNFVILGKGPVLSQLKLVLFLEREGSEVVSGEKEKEIKGNTSNEITLKKGELDT